MKQLRSKFRIGVRWGFVVGCCILLLAVGEKSARAQTASASAQIDWSKATLADVQKAAQSGNAAAEYDLGRRYQHSGNYGTQGLPLDYAQALVWYQKAAAQGSAAAEYMIGSMYQNSLGVTHDYQQALSWYQKAAAQGNAAADYQIYWLYSNGRGIQDPTQAAVWYQKWTAILHPPARNPHPLAKLGVEDAGRSPVVPQQAIASQQPAAGAQLVSSSATQQQSLQDTLPLNLDMKTVSGAQALYWIKDGTSVKIDPSGVKILKKDKGYKNSGTLCNDDNTVWTAYSETACEYASRSLGQSLPAADARIFQARFRDCWMASTRVGGKVNNDACRDLGNALAALGNENAAAAVLAFAPGCAVTDLLSYQFSVSGGTTDNTCLWEGFSLSASKDPNHPFDVQSNKLLFLAVAKQQCDRFHFHNACLLVEDNGGQVDQAALAAADRERAQLNATYNSEQQAAYDQQQAEESQKQAKLTAALSSLPGANDPNAIVDTANHEAARIIAIGAANDAARRQTAVQQPTQANAPQGVQGAANGTTVQLQTQQAAQQQSTASANPPSSSVTETCPSPQGSQGYPDYGVGCNPVRNMNSCIQVTSNTWRPNGGNTGMEVLVLSNTCSTMVRLTVGSAPIPTGGGAETQNVGAGQQFTWTSEVMSTSLPWQYQADDGTDCTVNVDRPGCSKIGN